MILGIDPGLNGACVLYDESNKHFWWKYALEPKQVNVISRNKKPKSHKIIDAYKLYHAILGNVPRGGLTAVFEQPIMTSKISFDVITSTGKSDGIIQAVLSILEIETVLIEPKIWQKLLTNVPGENTKEQSVCLASDIWPHESWLRTPRCTTPFDAYTDAALIAYYYSKIKPRP